MAFDDDSTETGRAFPRGLVLGFTMAEIAILIIFVLLLVLAAMLARESEGRERAESELEQYQELQKILEEEKLPQDPTVLRSYLVERVERGHAADEWRVLERGMPLRDRGLSAQEVLERLQRSEVGAMPPAQVEELLAARRAVEKAEAYAELEEALEEAGVSPSAGEIRDMAAAMRAADEQGMTPAEVRDAIENRAWSEAVDDWGQSVEPEERRALMDAAKAAAEQGLSPEQVRDSVEAQGQLQEALDERDRERERAESLETELRSLGGGTDHHSCWYGDDHKTASLFDVVLTERDRLVVDFADVRPEYVLDPSDRRLGTVEEARADLPVNRVRRQRPLSRKEFLRQTRSIHDWSKDNDPECRFFVRVFDLTAPEQKVLYKDLSAVVEQRFYIYKTRSKTLPPGLTRTAE